MNRLFFLVLLILCISCSKEEISEYATGNEQTGIVGKWKLVYYRSLDSWGKVETRDRTSFQQIISFDSLGNTTNPRFPCMGKYELAENPDSQKSKPVTLTVFFDCKTTESNVEKVEEKLAVSFRDNNRLVLNGGCYGMCEFEYWRLKE